MRVSVAVVAILLALAVPVPLAASERCAALEAQLARLDRRAADTDFSGAAANQRRQIAVMEGHLARCAGGPNCASFQTTLDQMRRNLTRLEAAARRGGGGAPSEAERSRIRQALARARCDAPARREAERRPVEAAGGGGLLGFFTRAPQPPERDRPFYRQPPFSDESPTRGGGFWPFVAPERQTGPVPEAGDERRRLPAEPRRRQPEGGFSPWRFGNGTFRTLCVRSCDGYYWPVSWSARPGAFARDEHMCRAACPNMEVALYVHRNPGQMSENAVSLDGRPYTALPTAFRYRSEFDRACTCRPVVTTAMTEEGDPRHGRSQAAPPGFAQTQLRGGFTPVPASFRGLDGDADPEPDAGAAPQL